MTMEGRWTILVGRSGHIHGWQTDRTSNILSGGPRMDTRAVPVVPCDDAAVERAEAVAEKILAPYASALSVPIVAEQLVEAVLRAAGETT